MVSAPINLVPEPPRIKQMYRYIDISPSGRKETRKRKANIRGIPTMHSRIICEHLVSARPYSRHSHIGTNKTSLACFSRQNDSLSMLPSKMSMSYSTEAVDVC